MKIALIKEKPYVWRLNFLKKVVFNVVVVALQIACRNEIEDFRIPTKSHICLQYTVMLIGILEGIWFVYI